MFSVTATGLPHDIALTPIEALLQLHWLSLNCPIK